MACTVKRLIETALAEVGYPEKASNNNLDSMTENAGSANFTKYARDLFKAGYYNGNKQGQPWCDPLVDWCFWKTCDENKKKAEYIQCQSGNLGAGCGFSLKYYKAAGRLDMNPQLGDQIFFKYTNDSSTADHTGIVVGLTATTIRTVEGNSGNKVSLRTYSRSYYAIIGYGHPRYDADATTKAPTKTPTKEEVKTVKIEMPVLKKGSKGRAVLTLQRLLRALRYVNTDGKALIAADGSFGNNTEAAVKRYQKNAAIGVDGIVGIKTWNKLLKGR